MAPSLCDICRKAETLKCPHLFCTHATFDEKAARPAECSKCSESDEIESFVIVDRSETSAVNIPEDGSTTTSPAPSSEPGSEDERPPNKIQRLPESCFRCSMRHLSCDGPPACKNCTALTPEEDDALGCRADDLSTHISQSVRDIGLGTGNLFIPGALQVHYRASITYPPPATRRIFKDFRRSNVDRLTALSQPPVNIHNFLKQFDNIKAHWPRCYEDSTEQIIRQCARYQGDLLRLDRTSHSQQNSSGETRYPNEENLIIALALRCLVLSHDVFTIEINLPGNVFESGDKVYECATYDDDDPLVDVWLTSVNHFAVNSRHQRAGDQLPHRLFHPEDDSFSTMLANLVALVQSILLRNRLLDYPLLIHTLCILELIRSNMAAHHHVLRGLRPGHLAIDYVCRELYRMFDFACHGHHPLSEKWEPMQFDEMVENEEKSHGREMLATEAMAQLNDLWSAGTEELHYDETRTFGQRVDDFVMGFTLYGI